MTNVDELRSQLKAATTLATNRKATEAQRMQAMADMVSLSEAITQVHTTRGDALIARSNATSAPINAPS